MGFSKYSYGFKVIAEVALKAIQDSLSYPIKEKKEKIKILKKKGDGEEKMGGEKKIDE